MKDRIDELLDITYENNKLNQGEFERNILANLISNIFPFGKR